MRLCSIFLEHGRLQEPTATVVDGQREMRIIHLLSGLEYRQFFTYEWVVLKIIFKAVALNQDIFTPETGLHTWFISQIRSSIPKCYLQSPIEYNPITAENTG